ncbi:hypothetical protein JAAARDRAFT_38005 [Jaapia argillacea MUCL 33604]|uniref:Uncharacterized protein n=1 Tax=Jaapia argillacea MUCL 33604 TaxID=933084 RepID=A0A067PJ94_9AGAM|nr:hypothetical protein JAAARDRAFT_38005 [Jaapia argillacea MUCL 33604]
MARATRSTVQQQEREKPTDPVPLPPPPRIKAGSKKRKRLSNVNGDVDGQPAAKQLKGDAAVKEEQVAEGDMAEALDENSELELQSAGDLPLNPPDAEKILDILEMVDTQGLLDRVFPLSTDSSQVASTSTSSPQSYSLRTLLKESSRYPLNILRSAIQHLFPISSHARSRPSSPASQQLRFCNLALNLLDQASFHSTPIPLDLDTILPSHPDISIDGEVHPEAEPQSTSHPLSASQRSAPPRKRKYALVQRLPGGDWWTSLDSDFVSPLDGKDLRDLPTAHAELVAVFPTPSASTFAPPPPSSSGATSDISMVQPTLGSLFPKKPPGPRQPPPGPRYVSAGSFLDYGPYASFAPTFDQEGVEVGRDTLGGLLWSRAERKSRRRKELEMRARLMLSVMDEERSRRAQDDDVVMNDSEVAETSLDGSSKDLSIPDSAEMESALQGLLDSEQVAALKSVLGSLELEQAVQELLDRNGRALIRLEELQIERLGSSTGGSTTVEVGSEEWDIATGIMDSLTLLASLRPRISDDPSSRAPLIPPDTVLRKLHRTLPVGPSQGWYGTLPSSRSTALRDDSTLRIKSGATITPAAPVALPATTPVVVVPPVASKVNPAAASTPYTPYPYPNYNASQYRASGYTYTPGQAGSYYPNTYGQAQGQAAGSSYYANPQYGTAAQPSQYSYSPWYSSYPPQSTPSGRGTPVPTPGSSVPPPTNYASYYNTATGTAAQQPQPQRAVANTVLSKQYQQTGAWTPGASGYGTAPPLPAHLRSTTSGLGAAGTPQPGATTLAYQQGYYGSYPTPPAPR